MATFILCITFFLFFFFFQKLRFPNVFAIGNNEQLVDKYICLFSDKKNIRPSNVRAVPDGEVNSLLDKMKTFKQLDEMRERGYV